MRFQRKKLSDEQLLDLYRALLTPRLIEEKMLLLLRQGKVTKWFAGIGQEAVAVGVTKALEADEYILPMHRNLGVFTSRGIPLNRLFAQFQGKMSGFTKGRDRSFHFGTNEFHISGMISHLGPQMCIANGIALGHQLKGDQKIAVAFCGDGATSEGDFHEALNVASVWQLPVIFIIENNGYGLSTPVSEQYHCEKLIDRAKGYGMKGKRIDGNNLLEVYHTISDIGETIREKPAPYFIECMTFRMRGHEEASGTKYVPQELFDEWSKKDPVKKFGDFLKRQKVLTDSIHENIANEIGHEIDKGLQLAFAEEEVLADTNTELTDIYQSFDTAPSIPSTETSEMRLVDAVAEGLREGMRKFEHLIIMGQDVADYGGVFKVTEGFTAEFGKERVRNTPLCESAILGAGFGLSLTGVKSIIEMQFADFVSTGFNQVVNTLAKSHYRWGQNADVVIRMPTGAGVGAGPFHSQSNEAWFTHTPGLKVVYPSSPHDAKGLLLASINDPNPVLFFEHKYLYRSVSGEVPQGYYTKEIGKASLLQTGEDISIITYGLGVHWAKELLQENPDISADLLDLRTLMPLDYEAIDTTVKKTGKVIILHEDVLTGGIGADIAAYISEHLFEYLDAPVIRSASMDTPVPFAANLEKNFLPKERFQKQLFDLLEY